MASRSDASEVNARPTRSPDTSRPVRRASAPAWLGRTGTKYVRLIEGRPAVTPVGLIEPRVVVALSSNPSSQAPAAPGLRLRGAPERWTPPRRRANRAGGPEPALDPPSRSRRA